MSMATRTLRGALAGAAAAAVWAAQQPLDRRVFGHGYDDTELLGRWVVPAAGGPWQPAGGALPRLWGSGRAFAQATWRHVLFGFVLGELERRLNPSEERLAPVDDTVV